MIGRTRFTRRAFIGASGALAAAAVLPPFATAAAVRDAGTPQDSVSDWHIDDIFGHYPRYSQAINYGRPLAQAVSADPMDQLFVV